MDEKTRQNRIDQLKLQFEVAKIVIPFASIAVAIEVFIIGSTFPDWLKNLGLGIMAIFLVLMGYIAKKELKAIDEIFKD